MRKEPQQSHYMVRDALDQPETKYVLFLTIGGVTNPLRVDGVRWADNDVISGGPGIEAYRTIGEVAEVVAHFPSETQWHMIAEDYLEAVTKAEIKEAFLAGLPDAIKQNIRYNRIVASYKDELEQSQGLDDAMRRMWGQSGEAPN